MSSTRTEKKKRFNRSTPPPINRHKCGSTGHGAKSKVTRKPVLNIYEVVGLDSCSLEALAKGIVPNSNANPGRMAPNNRAIAKWSHCGLE